MSADDNKSMEIFTPHAKSCLFHLPHLFDNTRIMEGNHIFIPSTVCFCCMQTTNIQTSHNKEADQPKFAYCMISGMVMCYLE